MECTASHNTHFPNMEIITATNLYFDGTRTHAVIACAFAAFNLAAHKLLLRKSSAVKEVMNVDILQK